MASYQGRIQQRRDLLSPSSNTYDSPAIKTTDFSQTRTKWSKTVPASGQNRYCWRTTTANGSWSNWAARAGTEPRA